MAKSKTYRIEVWDGSCWVPAPGDSSGWPSVDAQIAVDVGIVGLNGETFDDEDVRIVEE